MPAIAPREWLHELARRNNLVRRYLSIHNLQFVSDRGRPPPDVLEPAVLVGLISILVEENERGNKTFQLYLASAKNSEFIYLGDFLKSFWRRLRKRFGHGSRGAQ